MCYYNTHYSTHDYSIYMYRYSPYKNSAYDYSTYDHSYVIIVYTSISICPFVNTCIQISLCSFSSFSFYHMHINRYYLSQQYH